MKSPVDCGLPVVHVVSKADVCAQGQRNLRTERHIAEQRGFLLMADGKKGVKINE